MIKYSKSLRIVFALFLTLSLFINNFPYSDKNLISFEQDSNISTKGLNLPNMAINLDWNETLIRTGNASGRAVVVDSDGNIYLTGKEYNTSRGVFDIIIAKYNSSGVQKWKSYWRNISDSVGHDIAIDQPNNLYITGYIGNTTEDHDIILLKYDSTGAYQWNQTWGGKQGDIGYGIALNNSDIFITGITESYGTLGDVVLVKFDSSGHFQWNKTLGGSEMDIGYNLEVDALGNIYIAGNTSSFGAPASNGYLIKYNYTNEFEWNITWGGSLADDFYDLALNNAGDIYICGNSKSYSQGLSDITLFKYNSSGHLQFNESWPGSAQDYGYSIVVDSKNNSYITGYTQSYGGSDKDVCIIKFNSSGNFQWYKLWTQGFEDGGYDIALDQFNNKVITGATQTPGGDFDLFLAKFSPLPDDFTITGTLRDGILNISWQPSLEAENYSLYQNDKPITEFGQTNDSLTIVEGNTNRTYELKNLDEDVYYFMAIAFNKYGNTSSNCLKITVVLDGVKPGGDDGGGSGGDLGIGPEDSIIFPILLAIIIGLLGVTYSASRKYHGRTPSHLDTIEYKTSNIHFSIYTPTSISPGTKFILNLWAYLNKQKANMELEASKEGVYEKKEEKGPISAKKGDIFQVLLILPEEFEVLNNLDTITWLGDITKATFPVSVPKTIDIGIYFGEVQILIDGITKLRIHFTLEIGEAKTERIDSTQDIQEITKYFASYSSKDRVEVMKRVQGFMARSGATVFVDCLSMNPGENWEHKIYEEISKSDMLLLFWSLEAKQSEWVKKEWTFALNNRGLDFIQPFPLEDPRRAEPPKELESLHFNDKYLMILKGLDPDGVTLEISH